MKPNFTIPAFVLALFDGTATADPAAATGEPTTTGLTQEATATRGRDNGGRFAAVIPNTEDPKELRRALEDASRNYEREIGGAQARISELNAENEKHRNRFKETKTALDAVSAQVSASQQRVLRSDARDALNAAGALNPRIVDLFLADMGDKVKIDPKTGEPIGIAEALPEWKTANATFFKAETAAETEDQKKARLAAEAAAGRGNSTATGASTAATTETTTTTTGGIPDLRTLTPKERKAAMAAYKNSLR